MDAKTRMVAYCRCSTVEQATDGVSLAAQEAAIRAECERRSWELVDVVRDQAASGKSLGRPSLLGALARIASGEAEGLVVSRLDRASRSVQDFGMLLEWFEEADARFVALDLNIDTGTPSGRLVAHVMAAVAEWEVGTIAARTREGLAAVRADGRPISRTAVADRPEVAERIRHLRERGLSLRAIAKQLNLDGVPTARGGSEWRASSVHAAAGYRRRSRRRTSVALPAINRTR